MRVLRVVLLTIPLAATALAQRAALDPVSLVWYPPDAPVADYAAGRRNYGADLKNAFADPKLAAEVCRLVAGTNKANATTKELRQKQQRVTLEMACIAFSREQKELPGREAQRTNARQYLDGLLAHETAALEASPPRDRNKQQQAILDKLGDYKTELDAFKSVLRAMLLRPEDVRGTYWVLRIGPSTSSAELPITARDVSDFVESTYRARGNSSDANAWRWDFGLPEVLLSEGKYDEARNVQAGLMARRGYADSQYGQMLIATLDAIAGRRDALDAAMPKCKPAERCWDFAREISWRATGLLQQRSPKPLLEVLAKATHATGDNWPDRLRGVRRLASLDHVLGRSELTAVYAAHDVPEEAVIDAIRIDATLSHLENDQLCSISLLDCWILMTGGKVPTFPRDGWIQISAMKEPDDPNKNAPCFTPNNDPPGAEPLVKWDCALGALLDRFNLALSAHNFDLARQSLEKMVAYTLAQHLAPTNLRNSLAHFAFELNAAGHTADAQRVATYLESQPHSRVATMNLSILRERLPKGPQVFIEPWQSPTRIAPGTLPEVCGK